MTPVRGATGAIVAVLAALLLAWGSRASMRFNDPETGMIRLAWSARPERVERCVTRSDEELAEVPAHMRQRVACEGRSARYRLVVRRDGTVLADEVLTGGGARQDRPIYLLRDFPTAPGTHRLEVTFQRLDSVEAVQEDSVAPQATERERRETQERGRRRGEAIPARLEFAAAREVAARSVLLITYDTERRVLVSRAAGGSP
ncbi:MAG TPA: hypothetical protein VFY20_04040 [Gemmatimonadales bacterium]|nr:hypothetical protein [Gemmatimonadales bacterium]